MGWVKLDDNFPDHPKVTAVGDRAFRTHVRGMCYAARFETDGRVPRHVAHAWGRRSVEQLVAARLWRDLGDEYEIHDYLDYNPSREEREAKRMARAKAGAIGAAKRWGNTSQADAIDTGMPPTPAPSPTPTPLPSARSKAQPTDTQAYMLRRLHESESWQRVSFAVIRKFNGLYGTPVVTQALQRALEEPDPEKSGYGLLESMCKDIAAKETA